MNRKVPVSRNNEAKSSEKSFTKSALYLVVGFAMASSSLVFAKDSFYAKGQEYLDSKEWGKAQQQFEKMVKQGKGKQDAALYWLAYSFHKAKKNQRALKTIEKLASKYPESKWVDDGFALEAEIKDELGEAGDITNDEMKLYAIDSLMNASDDRAYKVLSKILKSNSSLKVKKRALFVLSQTSSKDGFKIVSDVALSKSNPQLQLVAIEMLGISGEKAASDTLVKLVSGDTSEAVKKKALDGLMVADDSDAVKSLAGKLDGKLQTHAIHLMGVMGQTKELLSMYSNNNFSKNKVEIIEAISIDEGHSELAKIIKSEKDQKLRTTAIERLGISSVKKSGKLLTELYKSSKSKDDKEAVIKALFIQSNAKSLIAIAKSEEDKSIKREAIKLLSLMESDEAVEFFSNILEKE